MTVATGQQPAESAAAVLSSADAPEPAAAPRLADGVELLGEFQNSGYRQPPSLAASWMEKVTPTWA